MPRWSWRRRYRHRGVGRPPKPVTVSSMPITERFQPIPRGNLEPTFLDPAEVEALRLIDIEKLSFEDAGLRMKVSRNTVWRLVEKAREKIARAIVQGKEIMIQKED